MLLDCIRIVLVEPAGPLNVGSIARVMKNMGLSHLVLVNPQCDRLGAEARQMAVHAVEVLESAQEVKTLPEALQGCQRAIATTGRSHTTLNIPLEHPRVALPWLLTDTTPPASIPVTMSALIFGREDHGLTNEELNHAQRLVLIPTNSAYASLNLAQAVAICCYELYVYATARTPEPWTGHVEAFSPSPLPALSPCVDLAPLDALEGYYQHLETLLLRIGYLYPHTAASRMEKLRRLFSRSYPSATEVAMLRGMLSQIEWALQQGKG
jgi:tRNA/rRNA methyltransferase